MSLASLLSTPCTIVLRDDSGDTDDDGNVAYGSVTYTTVCSLQQKRRDEPGGEGELSDTLWDLYLPTGLNVSTAEAALVGGHKYEFVGAPWDAQMGSPDMWHIEATVRRTAGAGDTA